MPGQVDKIPSEIIIKKEGSDQRLIHPQILPDGKTVLFTALKQDLLQIAVQSLESGERKDLFVGGPAQYVSTGHLVYGLEDSLYAVPFNPETLEVIGGGIPIEEGIFRIMADRPTHLSISESGTLAYLPGTILLGGSVGNTTLVWVDREGNETPLAAGNYGMLPLTSIISLHRIIKGVGLLQRIRIRTLPVSGQEAHLRVIHPIFR